MIKNIQIYLLVCCMSVCTNLYAQNFTGCYQSLSTSYKNDLDDTKNFEEAGIFNICITLDEHTIGDVSIENKAEPKVLNYNLIELAYSYKLENKLYYVYDAIPEHLESKTQSQVTIYANKSGRLNVMVSDKNSSQMFFNLKPDTK